MKNNIKMKKILRILLALMSTCFVIVMTWIIIDCFTTKKTATKKIITYNIKDDIDYDVVLRDNKYFSNNDSIEYYPLELIDKMEVSFVYDLVGSNFFSSDYSYEIVASLQSKVGNDIVWKKDETILNKKNGSKQDIMNVSIFDTTTIDVNHFYEEAKEFYETTGNDVDLIINVNIVSKLAVRGYAKSITDNQILSLSLSMTDKMTKINTNTNNNPNKNVLVQYQVNDAFNSYLFVLSVLVLVALLPVAIMSYVSLFNLINLDDYTRKLKVIKKKYKYLINEVSEEPIFKDKEVVQAATIKEVIDICNDKDLVLSIYERTSGCECWVYVEDEKEVILYILTPDYREIDMKDNSKVIHIRKKKKTNKDK